MKSWKGTAFLGLLLCLFLTGCTPKGEFTGEITQVWMGEEGHVSALALKNDQGEEMGVWIGQDTKFSGEMDYQVGNVVMAAYDGKGEPLTNAEGKALEACQATDIYAYEWVERGGAALKDGTVLDILWPYKSGMFSKLWTYKVPNGPRLLTVMLQEVPQTRNIGGEENPEFTLSETAQEKVRAYYEAREPLYDLDEELERAWEIYHQEKEDDSRWTIKQTFFAPVSSQRVMVFTTDIFTNTKGPRRVSTAFDRETGETVPLWDLFACSPEELAEAIFAENKVKEPLKGEIMEVLSPENVVFWGDTLSLEFAQGTLPDQKLPVHISVKYEKILSLFQDWAVPILWK